MHRHKAAAINERRICSQLICWYVLYYRASLDLTKELSLQLQHTRHTYVPIHSDMLFIHHWLEQRERGTSSTTLCLEVLKRFKKLNLAQSKFLVFWNPLVSWNTKYHCYSVESLKHLGKQELK